MSNLLVLLLGEYGNYKVHSTNKAIQSPGSSPRVRRVFSAKGR